MVIGGLEKEQVRWSVGGKSLIGQDSVEIREIEGEGIGALKELCPKGKQRSRKEAAEGRPCCVVLKWG